MQPAGRSPDCLAARCLSLLQELLGSFHPREFAVRLWDGSVLPPGPGLPARFTLVIRTPGAMRTLFLSPTELSLGEAFVHGGPYFSDHYVFPDGEILPFSTTLRTAEETGFEVRDVESLREHYVLTLRRWAQRLEAHSDDARRVVGEVTYRVWRLYLSGAAHTFSVGKNNVYQALLSRPDGGRSGLPLSREDWYRSGPRPC